VVTTDSPVVLVNYVADLITAAASSIGIKNVWIGDREKFPYFPCVTVEADTKNREYMGAPRKTLITFGCIVVIFHGAARDLQDNYSDVLTLGETVEGLLHADPKQGGLVIDSLVTRVEPAFANRGGALLRATRLTLTATSQKLLPYNP
jgi:hypothetical protein